MFDSQKYYLGNLCKRSHDHEKTNKSLRYIKGCGCIECGKERQQTHKDEIKLSHKKYRDQNAQKIKTRNAKYRKTRKEFIKAYTKEYYQQNKAELLAKRKNPCPVYTKKYRKEYESKNKDKIRQYKREYRKTESGKKVARHDSTRRRYRKKTQQYTSYTHDQLMKRRAEVFNNECFYCGATSDLTNDHFFPLSKGGFDSLENIFPACRSCNSSKGAKDPFVWYKEQGGKNLAGLIMFVSEIGFHKMSLDDE